MTIDTTVVETQNYVEKLTNVVAKTIVEAFENLTIEDVDMFKLGYNKAIDDFEHELTQSNIDVDKLDCEDIYKIADKLKGANKKHMKNEANVCEWITVQNPNALPIFYTQCGKYMLEYVTGLDVYCRYCGRRIKLLKGAKQND